MLLGPSYERNIPVVTAKEVLDDKKDNNKSRWEFTKPEEQELEYVETPFDGVGMISPDYAELINNSLKISGATSFQVRMPFVKGMLHQVDFQMFLSEFGEEGKNEDEYIYEDAFGIKRDLRKAQILLTETMFKCNKWLNEYCKQKNVIDPMTIYCNAIKQYEHGLYISGTNLPYGNSKFTHLSYQMLNTLALTDEQFEKLIKEHNSFIENPIEYIRDWDSSEAFDYEKTELDKKTPSWKSALFFNDEFKNDDYIASQLRGIQRGLVTKIANGKIVVTGQTRYLCRDLLPLLATLIKEQREVNKFYTRCLFMRFYMPLEDNHKHIFDNNPNYKYSGYGAFFRSPHLSRSEECLLQPFLMPGKGEEYIQTKGMISKNKYEKYINMYDKYFGHLTGVVMVPRGSIVPLCLGGADFDGDLVNVVFDENVVEAVKRGCYKTWLFRKLPVVKIPKTSDIEETIPKYVPYDHIEKTFSNSIG